MRRVVFVVLSFVALFGIALPASAHPLPAGRQPVTGYTFGCPDVQAGQRTLCTVADTDPRYAKAEGTISFTSRAGRFSPAVCRVRTDAQGARGCSVYYVPRGAVDGTRHDQVTASYSGDRHFLPVSGSTYVTVVNRAQASLTLTCGQESSVSPGKSAPCTVDAVGTYFEDGNGFGVTPTGTVTFTATNGTVDQSSCTLQDGGAGESFCQVDLTQQTAGDVSLTGTYSGDGIYVPATVTFSKAAAGPGAGRLRLTCPATTTVGVPSTCTVAVGNAADGTPYTGSVTLFGDYGHFTTSDGEFTPASCDLVAQATVSSCTAQWTSYGNLDQDVVHANYGSQQDTAEMTVVH